MTQTQPETLPATMPDTDLERFRTVGYWLSLAESGSESDKAKGAAAALRLYYAHELGLPPLAAAELSVINGRVFVGAKLLRALAAQRGYRVIQIESTPDTCTAAVEDLGTGRELGRYTFTIEDAKRAGLVRDRGAWKTHPARMLWARASKYVLDDYAPEVTLGIYTDDERAEILNQPATVPPPEPLEADEAEWTPADPEPGPDFGHVEERAIGNPKAKGA